MLTGIVTVTATALYFGLMKKDTSQKEDLTSTSSQSLQSAPKQQERGIKLEGIKYTEVSEDGRNRWKIIAKEVEIFLNEKKSLLSDVYVEFYLKNDRVIKLSSDKGTFFAGVKDIELSGNVTITLPDGLVLRTERAVYKNREKELLTEGNLSFSSDILNGKIGKWRYKLDEGIGYGEEGITVMWRITNSKGSDKNVGFRKASF